jgi:hypothetical protein
MHNPYKLPRPQSWEERRIQKVHAIARDGVRAQIKNFNFEIEFIEHTWVIKEYSGGFDGEILKRELVQITGNTPCRVLEVQKDKKKQCSRIFVWSDGMADGNRCHFINVPNGLFKQIK